MAKRWTRKVGGLGSMLLDFALPPRCAGCRDIIDLVGAFCPDCWGRMHWLGNGGCETCGLPLEGSDVGQCARCLAVPPPFDRVRAAVAYDELPRAIALRLKYGRQVALAKTMARYMAPLGREWGGDAVVVPVPLHRWRLWSRGFNQAALVARELGRAWHLPDEPHALRRIRRTRPLKGLGPAERRRTVAGAFAVPDAARIRDRTVVLVDDVLTSGSTSDACARALRRAGAARVELICWARVVRPAQLMR